MFSLKGFPGELGSSGLDGLPGKTIFLVNKVNKHYSAFRIKRLLGNLTH
jgi:hypothetical protein